MKQHTVGIDISKAHLDAHRMADEPFRPGSCSWLNMSANWSRSFWLR